MTILSIGIILLLLKSLINCEFNESPCPDLFEYSVNNNETGEYIGIVVLLSKTDLLDVWVQLTFNKPFIKLATVFGEVVTTNGIDFFIEKPKFMLKANTPHKLFIVLKYTIGDPPPMLESFKLNGILVCESFNSICGTRTKVNKLSHSDIVIRETEEGEYPWHAALYHYNLFGENRIDYLCAGSLISNFHIITAASCAVWKNPDNFTVYMGQYYKNRLLQPDIVQERRVAKIILHPGYKRGTGSKDIALFKFTTPVEFTDYVRPICLWKESHELSSVINRQGVIVGWDIGGTDLATDKLLRLNYPVVSQQTCLRSDQAFVVITDVDTYCAGFRNGISVCQGNSGAGMFFPVSNSNSSNPVWQLRGLVSSSVVDEAGDCRGFQYVVFADTAQHLEWINSAMKI